MKRQFLIFVKKNNSYIRKISLYFTGGNSTGVTLESISVIENKVYNGSAFVDTKIQETEVFVDLCRLMSTTKFQQGVVLSSDTELITLLTAYKTANGITGGNEFAVNEIKKDLATNEDITVNIL